MNLITTCKECKHFKNKEPTEPREDAWYNHLCTAHPREKIINPVTGIKGYSGVNFFGARYITDDPYEFCRDHNDGFCKDFAGK